MDMGLLFMMPRWSAPSEVWMQRMLEALAENLAYVAAEGPADRLWRGTVPTVQLERPPSLYGEVLRRLGFQPPDRDKRALAKAVHSERVTCILVHWLDFALRYGAVWHETNKPLFVHCHGYDVTWNLRPHDRLRGNPVFSDGYRDEVRRLAQRAVLIANSRCTAQKLADIGVPPSRIAVHYFGVPSREALPTRPPKTSEIKLLFLGRLVDFKGPDLVIRAFELACSRGFRGRLIIAGDGPLGTMCELMRVRSRYSQRIQLLGAVDAKHAAELRMEADIFTAHSCIGPISQQEEGFGVAFAEAMADALPVVTGRSGALGEIVDDGVTGVLFESGDVEAHANILLELANNPEMRLRMGKAGWRRAKEHFSSERERSELLKILGLDRESCAE